MTVQIYAMTHKEFEQPKNSMYVPLQVGAAIHNHMGYLTDDTGDNISKLNPYYAELTGVYWVWKNIKHVDYVGVCHYRRYLLNAEGKMFTESEIKDLFLNHKYDIFTTKKVILDHSYYDGFSGRHNVEDLIATEQVIGEKYPEYLHTYQKLVHSNETYFGNMMITDKDTYDQYASWLFDIFFTLQERIDPSKYDDYRMRVYGFISEFLLYVWVTYHQLKVLECDVAVIGEKKETKETKERLALYFEKGDLQGAKSFFWSVYQKRPDVLMEASDFDGTLKLAMQAISTAEYEQQKGIKSTFEQQKDFEQTIMYYRMLNKIVNHIKMQKETAEDWRILHEMHVSEAAVAVAVQLVFTQNQKEQANEIMQELKERFVS